jgi:hypothetical protein
MDHAWHIYARIEPVPRTGFFYAHGHPQAPQPLHAAALARPIGEHHPEGRSLMTLLNDITAFLASLTGLVLALNQTIERFRKPRGKRKRNGRRR